MRKDLLTVLLPGLLFQGILCRSASDASAARFAAGDEPQSVAAADLNGDGKSDIVVANQRSDDLTVLLGDGHGGFAPAPGSPFPAGRHPNDIAVGDLDGDGRPDLALANHEQQYLTLLLGDGLGGFRPASGSPLAVPSEPHTHMVQIGDFDRDRKPDLLVDSWGNSRVLLLRGDGRGGFASPGQGLSAGSLPYYRLRTGDLTGDGITDLVVLNLRRDALSVFLGDGRGGFQPAPGSPFPAGKPPFSAAIGDLDGDGHADLAVANYSGGLDAREGDGLSVLLGDGAGGLRPAAGSPFRSGWAPTEIALGDVNGDGILDAAASNLGSAEVTVLLGSKERLTAAPGSPFQVGRSPTGIALADFDGNGKADIVVANGGDDDVTVLLSP